MSFSTKFTLLVALFLCVKSDKPDTKCNAPVLPAKKNGIDGQYIVVMRDDATDKEDEEIRKTIESSGGKIRHHWSNKGKGSNYSKFQGFSLKVDGKRRAAVLRKAKSNCKVSETHRTGSIREVIPLFHTNERWLVFVENFTTEQSIHISVKWGLGATIYVIDSGCNETHPDLRGRITYKKNLCSSEPSNYDLNGHGTGTASCVVGKKCGAAKNAKVVCLKALNAQGTGSYSDIIAAVNYVAGITTDKGIMSMSLGGGYSSAVNSAVQNAYVNGHLPVVAAGHENQDASNFSPASTPSAITVAASDRNNNMASFTNYGKFVDIIAPGVSCNIASKNNGYGSASGTSFSAPYCSGIGAVIQTQLGLLLDPNAPSKITTAMLNAAKNGLIGSMKPDTVNKLLFWDNCNLI